MFIIILLIISILTAKSDDSIQSNFDGLTFGDSCHLSGGQKGICTQFLECDAAKKLFRERKYSEISRCGFQREIPIVCCPRSTKFTGAICKNGPLNKIRLIDKITNGKKAGVGEFPFQVALGRKTLDGTLDFNCGGSLIANDVILTAAHCFIYKDYAATMVRLGRTSLDLNDTNDDSTVEDIEIQTFKLHPNFSRRTRHHDIALLKLKKPAQVDTFNFNIQPICLSTSDQNVPKNLTITGYGRTDPNNLKIRSNWLLYGIVQNFPLDECKAMYKSYGKEVIDSQYCAFSNAGVDACQGDSGGSLSYERDGIFYQYGVTSYGAGCGSQFPAIYTKVNQYLDWIEKEMMEFENK